MRARLVLATVALVSCSGSQHAANNASSSPPASSSEPSAATDADAGNEHTEGERHCVAGDREACRQLALEYQGQCDHGHLHRCVLLGLLYEHGRGVERDYTHADQLFVRACEGHELRGCAQYAALFSE